MKGRRIDWKKSGIYSIICTVNGKQYIGCSKDIYSRINAHKSYLKNNKFKQDNKYFTGISGKRLQVANTDLQV